MLSCHSVADKGKGKLLMDARDCTQWVWVVGAIRFEEKNTDTNIQLKKLQSFSMPGGCWEEGNERQKKKKTK